MSSIGFFPVNFLLFLAHNSNHFKKIRKQKWLSRNAKYVTVSPCSFTLTQPVQRTQYAKDAKLNVYSTETLIFTTSRKFFKCRRH